MITVVVRRAEGGKGVALGEFYPSDIPDLINLARGWQTHIDGRECLFVDAQFAADENGAVFEIIVGSGEEG